MKIIGKTMLPLVAFIIHACIVKTHKENADNGKNANFSKETPQETIIGKSHFVDYLKYFKYKNKSDFKISYDLLETDSLISLKTNDLGVFLKNKDIRQYNDSLLYKHYYYSYQNKTDRFESLTLVLNTEYRWDLFLLTYDLKGNFIDKIALSSFGGDGNFSFSSYGKFINDSTYYKTIINEQYLEDENGEDQIKIDSIQEQYLLKNNGEISKIDY